MNPVLAELEHQHHSCREIRTPGEVIWRCSCGWSATQTSDRWVPNLRGGENMTTIKKPVRRFATCAVPHGIKADLAITLYPGGVIGLREKGRRREVQIAAGVLYAKLLAAEVGAGQKRRS